MSSSRIESTERTDIVSERLDASEIGTSSSNDPRSYREDGAR